MPAPPCHASAPSPRARRHAAWLLASLLLLALALAALSAAQARRSVAEAQHGQALALAHALADERPPAATLQAWLDARASAAAATGLWQVELLDAPGRPIAAWPAAEPAPPNPWWQPEVGRVAVQGPGAAVLLQARLHPQAMLRQWAAGLLPALLALGLLAAVALALAALMRRHWQAAVRAGLARMDEADDTLPSAPGQAAVSAVPAGPVDPVLRPLLDGLAQALARQRRLLDAQREQLEQLRTLAHADPLTGLPNRRHFLASLDALLRGESAPAESGLVLLRLRDLQGLNQRLGHAAADHVLQALGQALQAYPDRIERCQVGRLNGADFALWLPAGGLATETAQSLLQALRQPLRSIDPGASVAAGVVELSNPIPAQQALAAADAALARAEAEAGFSLSAAQPAPAADAAARPQGHAAWQRRIGRALVQGRVALGAYPVRTADGRQLHLDCPLRVALSADGPLEPASRWLSQAVRSRLCAAVDDKALTLALAAIRQDGQARCINIAGQSVSDPEFIGTVTRRLEAAPDAACRLWIDLPEALALERPALVRELSRRWRPLGVMLGLEHAGEALPRMPRLMDLGLDCVRIDSRFVNGLAGPEADSARRYLQGLVRLVQSVGLQACAEGVRAPEDLEVLWALGFDAATGPALVGDLQPA